MDHSKVHSSETGRFIPAQQPEQSDRVVAADDRLGDFRSVIDDLTVENRNLQRRLKRLEYLTNAPTPSEKLFEVHVYGLSASRQSKLERALRTLAVEACDTHATHTSTSPKQTAHQQDAFGVLDTGKRSLSSTSNLHPVDSAIDLSTSSTSSLPPSGLRGPSLASRPARTQDSNGHLDAAAAHGDLSIHQSQPLSSRAKKQLVVRKLEQLFVGRERSPPEPARQMQRRKATCNTRGGLNSSSADSHYPTSGVREAKMSAQWAEPRRSRPPTPSPNSSEELSANDMVGQSENTPDQRPTRPVDLDLSRPQNASENIMYMKHLGFASPKMDPTKDFREGEGWIFLNLLMNMAQLHTAHVTPDFVRSALKEMSTKFEVSADGRCIRWKGGKEATHMGADNVESIEQGSDSPSIDFDEAPLPAQFYLPTASSNEARAVGTAANQVAKLSHSDSRMPEPKRDIGALPINTHSNVGKTRTELPSAQGHAAGEICSTTSESVQSNQHALLEPTKPSDKQARPYRQIPRWPTQNPNDSKTYGLMVFYNSADFCIDLTCDKDLYSRSNPHLLADHVVLGLPCSQSPQPAENGEQRGLLSGSFRPHEPPSPVQSSLLSPFPGSSWPSQLARQSRRNLTPMQLEASGLGGVVPEDNFTIHVTTHQTSDPSRPAYLREVASHTTVHPPASLPPPSYVFLPYSSSLSDDGDLDSLTEGKDIPFQDARRPIRFRTIVSSSSLSSSSVSTPYVNGQV